MRALDRSTSSSSVGELDQPNLRPSVDGRTGGIGGFDLQRVPPQRSSPRDDNAPQARAPASGGGLMLASARLLPQPARGAPNGGQPVGGPPRPNVPLPTAPPRPTQTTTTTTTTTPTVQPAPTGKSDVQASKEALKAVAKTAAEPGKQHAVADDSRLLDWASLEGSAGRKMRGDTAKSLRANVEDFAGQAAKLEVSGGPHHRARDVATLKGIIDHALLDANMHLGSHAKDKGESAVGALREQLATYKALLDDIARDGPPPGVKTNYLEMLKVRAFGLPDAAFAEMATHGKQGLADMGPLGSGAINSTRLVQFPGEAHPMVFKPMHAVSEGASGLEKTAGIDLDKPQFANRNIATTVAAHHLGLDHLVPRTVVATVGGQVGIAMERLGGFALNGHDPKPMPVTDRQERMARQMEGRLKAGKDSPAGFMYGLKQNDLTIKPDGTYGGVVFAAHLVDTRDSSLVAQLNDLEWLHQVTGELDPNLGNMRVEHRPGPGGTTTQHLKAFDFDFSFGSETYDTARHGSPMSRTGPPPLIGRSTYDALVRLEQTWPQASREYARLLPAASVQAMEVRLFGGPYTEAGSAQSRTAPGLMDHVRTLAQNNRVVDDWSTWRGDEPPGSGNQVDAPTLTRQDGAKARGYLAGVQDLADDAHAKRALVGL